MRQITLIPLLKLDEVKKGQLFGVEAEGVNLLISHNLGEIAVFEGSCPHQGTLLADGSIEDGNIVCPAHHWKFNCSSGKKKGSQKVCLKKFDVVIEDGDVLISEEELMAWKASKRQSVNLETDKNGIRKFEDVAGPKGWPLMGNLYSVLSDINNLHKTLNRWAVEYGSIYRISGIMKNRSLVISDPTIARELLMDRPHTFRRIKTMEAAMKEVGLNGLITAEGDLWKRYRKFATHGLANRLLRDYFLTIERSTTRLFKIIKKGADANTSMDIQNDLLRYTVDVTSSLAFGVDINTLEHNEDNLQNHLALVLPIVQRRMMIPIPYWRFIKLPSDFRLDKSLKIIKDKVDGFISDAKERIKAKPEIKNAPANFLEALLSAQDEDGNFLSDEEVYANVFSILLAGEDSTANSIAWVIYYMTEMPEIQKRMQEEIDSVMGDSYSLASFEQLQRLPFIEAVVQETLRLKPVLPVVQLCANEDTVISNIEVPKDTNIQLPIYNMFLDDKAFENSKEFNPDRWLDDDITRLNAMNNAFLPFGYGPRVCPGRSLALLENKAVLAMICRFFTVTRPENAEPVGEIFSGLIQPVNLKVNFKLRDHLLKKSQTFESNGGKIQGGCPMGFH